MPHLHHITRGFVASLNKGAAAWEKGHLTPEHLHARAVDLMGPGIPRDVYALIDLVGFTMHDVDEAIDEAYADNHYSLADAMRRDWVALSFLSDELYESQA